MLKELRTVNSKESLMRLFAKWRKNYISFDNKGNSILHLAVYTGRIDVVKYAYELLKDCNYHLIMMKTKNHKGHTPFELASHLSFLDIQSWLERSVKFRDNNEKKDSLSLFYKNMETLGMNVKIKWAFVQNNKTIVSKKSELYRGPVFQKTIEFAKENSIDFSIKKAQFFLKSENLFDKMFTKLNMALFKQEKKYPWKYFNPQASHPFIDTTHIVIESVFGKKIKKLANSSKSNVISLVASVCDEVLQEELLLEKVSSDNVLVFHYEQELSHSLLPIQIKKNNTLLKKTMKLKAEINKAIFSKKHLRINYEIEKINKLFEKKDPSIKYVLKREESRFATYNYLGEQKLDLDSSLYTLVSSGKANPFSKSCITFYFKNDELVICLDIHSQVLEKHSHVENILLKIKERFKEIVKEDSV